MASFCGKCGAQLSANTKFCGSCGTPADTGASRATSAGQVPAGAPQSGGALKIILIIVGVFVGLGVLSVAALMFGVWRFSKNVHVDRANGGVTITTPQGQITTQQAPTHATEEEVGAPLYPGAETAQGSYKVSGGDGSMGAAYSFKTDDSVQQVVAFYRDKFGPQATVMESPQGAMIASKRSERESFVVNVARDAKDGRTTIMITHGITAKNK